MQDDGVREAFERKARAVSLRPSIGQKTARTSVRLKAGLECAIEEGPWAAVAGMSESWGGNNAGPSPGFFGRGALGSCLTIGIAMWAARLEIPIDGVEVMVEADYDSRGELGVADDIPPGYTQVRCITTVTSSASEPDVRRVVEMAEKYSPYRDVFARAHDIRGELRIVSLLKANERSE